MIADVSMNLIVHTSDDLNEHKAQVHTYDCEYEYGCYAYECECELECKPDSQSPSIKMSEYDHGCEY